jgi:hypothetical protein
VPSGPFPASPCCRTVRDMDVEHGEPYRSEPVPTGAPVGADRLDDDAEALEDPVHAGDARHQHERHERDEPAER